MHYNIHPCVRAGYRVTAVDTWFGAKKTRVGGLVGRLQRTIQWHPTTTLARTNKANCCRVADVAFHTP